MEGPGFGELGSSTFFDGILAASLLFYSGYPIMLLEYNQKNNPSREYTVVLNISQIIATV